MESGMELILLDEKNNEIDDLQIRCTIRHNNKLYAAIEKDETMTFLKVENGYLKDICSDKEYEEVKSLYNNRS